jgi:hypothetical protein
LSNALSLVPNSCHSADPLGVSHDAQGASRVGALLARKRRSGLLVGMADGDRKTFSLVAFPMLIVAPSQPKESRHEAFDHLAIAAGRPHRLEHAGSKRRCRLRRRSIPGRLRCGSAPRRRGCAASRRRRPASGGASQSVLILVRCILLAIALAAVITSIVPARAQTGPPAATISPARELVIDTKEAPPSSMKGPDGTRQGISIEL